MPRDRSNFRSRSPKRLDYDTDKRQKDTTNDGKDTLIRQARSRSRSLVRDTGKSRSPVRKRRRDDSMSRSRSRSREPRRRHLSRSREGERGEKRRRARSISSSSDSSEGTSHRRKEHRKDKNREGKRSKSKERRREKRREKKEKKEKVCTHSVGLYDDFDINTEKEGERKCTTLGKVWNNFRCGVRQFIYLFSSHVPNLFQLASLPKTKSSILGWSRNERSILKRFLKSSKKRSSLALLKIIIQVLQHLHLLLRFIQLLFSYIIPREVLQHGSLRETYVSTQTRRILATCK
jgi:hypothetical protein